MNTSNNVAAEPAVGQAANAVGAITPADGTDHATMPAEGTANPAANSEGIAESVTNNAAVPAAKDTSGAAAVVSGLNTQNPTGVTPNPLGGFQMPVAQAGHVNMTNVNLASQGPPLLSSGAISNTPQIQQPHTLTSTDSFVAMQPQQGEIMAPQLLQSNNGDPAQVNSQSGPPQAIQQPTQQGQALQVQQQGHSLTTQSGQTMQAQQGQVQQQPNANSLQSFPLQNPPEQLNVASHPQQVGMPPNGQMLTQQQLTQQSQQVSRQQSNQHSQQHIAQAPTANQTAATQLQQQRLAQQSAPQVPPPQVRLGTAYATSTQQSMQRPAPLNQQSISQQHVPQQSQQQENIQNPLSQMQQQMQPQQVPQVQHQQNMVQHQMQTGMPVQMQQTNGQQMTQQQMQQWQMQQMRQPQQQSQQQQQVAYQQQPQQQQQQQMLMMQQQPQQQQMQQMPMQQGMPQQMYTMPAQSQAPHAPQVQQYPPAQLGQPMHAQQHSSLGSTKFAKKVWHNDSHVNLRTNMVDEIISLLKTRRPNATEDWHEKLPHMAKRLEDALYHEADNAEEYSNKSSLKERLQKLALSMGGNRQRNPTQTQQIRQQQPQQNQQQHHYSMQQQQQLQPMSQQYSHNQQSQPMQQQFAPQQQQYQQQMTRTAQAAAASYPIVNQPGGITSNSAHQTQAQQQPSGMAQNANQQGYQMDYNHQMQQQQPIAGQQMMMQATPYGGNNSSSQYTSGGQHPMGMLTTNQAGQMVQNGGNSYMINGSVDYSQQQMVNGRPVPMQQMQQMTANGQMMPNQSGKQMMNVGGNGKTMMAMQRQQMQGGGAPLTSSGHSEEHRKQVLKQQQQRLLLLRHASKCPHEQDKCPVTPHCWSMKQLWKHIMSCKDQECKIPHCVSSRYVLSHYSKCKEPSCPVCGPVREAIKRNYERSRDVVRYARNPNQVGPNGAPIAMGQQMNGTMSSAQASSGGVGGPLTQNLGAPVIHARPTDLPEPAKKKAKKPTKKEQAAEAAANAQAQQLAAANAAHTQPMGAGGGIDPSMQQGMTVQQQQMQAMVARQQMSQGSSKLVISNKAVPPQPRSIYPLDPISCSIYSFTDDQINAHFKTVHEGLRLTGSKIKDMCKPILEELYKTPHVQGIFGTPVDPVALGLPDYFDVIKSPMDLGTVMKRLDSSSYRDLHNFVLDVHRTFDNAMLYNPKNTEVHSLAKLMKREFDSKFKQKYTEFERTIEGMRSNQESCLICGEITLKFEPPVYYCNGTCGQRIRRSAPFYSNVNNTYHWCSQCFGNLKDSETIRLPDCTVTKKELAANRKKHSEESEEGWVQCDGGCQRWVHQVCSLFNARRNTGEDVGYVCPLCIQEHRKKHPNDQLVEVTTKKTRAVDLQVTTMSQFLEKRIYKRLDYAYKETAEKNNISIDDVEKCPELILRQVSCQDKNQQVREGVYARYKEKGYPEEFPCRTKCVLLFQNIDGQDVILFGMYVYEYGHKCPEPNRRRVYISYLDSVHYLRPKQYRTMVYHEILISYLDYVKHRGFHTAHIWACPPQKGDDYILYVHPTDQKTPKPQILRLWYDEMLKRCVERKIVTEFTDLHTEFLADPSNDATVLPYFEGDYWVNEAEVIIKNLRDGSNIDEDGTDGAGKKSKRKSKSKRVSRPLVKTLGGTDRDPVMTKLANIIEPMKDTFFVARLHSKEYIEKLCGKENVVTDSCEKGTKSDDGAGIKIEGNQSAITTNTNDSVLATSTDINANSVSTEQLSSAPRMTVPTSVAVASGALAQPYVAPSEPTRTATNEAGISGQASADGPKLVVSDGTTSNLCSDPPLQSSSAQSLNQVEASTTHGDSSVQAGGSGLDAPQLESKLASEAGSVEAEVVSAIANSDGAIDTAQTKAVAVANDNEASNAVTEPASSLVTINTSDNNNSLENVNKGEGDLVRPPSEGVVNTTVTIKTEGAISEATSDPTAALTTAGGEGGIEATAEMQAPKSLVKIEKAPAGVGLDRNGEEGSAVEKDANSSVSPGSMPCGTEAMQMMDVETKGSSEGATEIGEKASDASAVADANSASGNQGTNEGQACGVKDSKLGLIKQEDTATNVVYAKAPVPAVVPIFSGEDMPNVSDDTEDLDDVIDSEHFETRQSFLNLCQGNHYQFDQLRRAKHTSMMVLYHLHNPDAPKFVPTCNSCHSDILTGYRHHCETCDQDFCQTCYSSKGGPRIHNHSLRPIALQSSAPTQLTEEQRRERQRSIQLHMQLLQHAANCVKCESKNCMRMKEFLKHDNTCQKKVAGGCRLCARITNLLNIHARNCRVENCKVPRCSDLREQMRKLTLRQQQMDDRRRKMMNSEYTRSTSQG